MPRGKTLGGSSAINAQVWIPGHPSDYEDWPEGWSWEDVRPWFERIESGPGSISAQRDPSPMSRAFVDAAAAATGIPTSGLNLERLEGAGLARSRSATGSATLPPTPT
jgi:choline dehydrogenase-like flavoprotein